MESFSRRKALLLGSSSLASVFTGCTALPFVENPIDVTFINRDTERHRIGVEAIRTHGDREYSEAVELREWYDLPARTDEGAGVVHEDDLLPSAVYTIRVNLEAGRADQTFHYHFYPDCTGGTEDGRDRPEDEFHVEVQQGGKNVVFKQNTCSDDSWTI